LDKGFNEKELGIGHQKQATDKEETQSFVA